MAAAICCAVSTDATSVSIVDLEERRFVQEITVTGCALVYPAGPRRFGMLCGDGTAMTIHLTAEGELDRIARSPRFFDRLVPDFDIGLPTAPLGAGNTGGPAIDDRGSAGPPRASSMVPEKAPT